MKKFQKNREYFLNTEHTVTQVRREINAGLKVVNGIRQPIITIFGSHRVSRQNKNYRHAHRLAHILGQQKIAVMTGGGPGIMEAANRGAFETGAISIGFPAQLLKHEKVDRKIMTHCLPFHFLFVRRFIMSIKSDGLVFYPGGFGTLNELFEYLVLMQTGIVDRVPIVCVDSKFWGGLVTWIRRYPQRQGLFTFARDVGLLQFVDTQAEVLKKLGFNSKRV